MPLPSFLSSNKSTSTDPQTRREEKRIAGDEHVDQKSLDHALHDLKKAEKTHLNAVKASDKAQHALDRAVKNEHKAATTLNKSQHQHEASVMEEANAEKTLELNREHQARLEQDLQQRRSALDEVQHRKDVNDQTRETTLSGMHARAASRAGSRADSGPHAPYPVDRGATTGSETTSAESFSTASDGTNANNATVTAMPLPDVGTERQKSVSFV